MTKSGPKAPFKFHFFSSAFATRFHIARTLMHLGWEKSSLAEAQFSDLNLSLNDDIAIHLEYKHLLAELMARHYPDIMPLSYCIDDDNHQKVIAAALYDQNLQENTRKWILKPSLLNNAQEIKLFNNLEAVRQHFLQPKRLGGAHVLQEYLINPDLIEGRKYSFRIIAVLTNYAGVFLYHQGYVNISAYSFEDDNFNNKKIHITNYVLDEQFSGIEQRLISDLPNFSDNYQQISKIITQVLKATLKSFPQFLKTKANKSFELYGFDFIKDSEGKIWLLEINQAPDAPTFEHNPLTESLWQPFWRDLVDDFVLPIACPDVLGQYPHFNQLMSAKACYSLLRQFCSLWTK